MKKIMSYLRSMSFGVILLCLITACSIVGSVIPQNAPESYYLENFGWGSVLIGMQLDHIFSGWCFIGLAGLLCLNLFLCTLMRLKNNLRFALGLKRHILCLPLTEADDATVARAEKLFSSLGMRCVNEGESKLYSKNKVGIFASFITHLGLFTTVIFAAFALCLAQVEDIDLRVGENATLADGVKIVLTDFRSTDASGQADYVSTLELTDANGVSSGSKQISVNMPVSFAGHKYYQQTYGALGSVTAIYKGTEERMSVADKRFFSMDGANGLAVMGVYPDYVVGQDGKYTLITTGVYKNPVYAISIIEQDDSRRGVLLPGDSIEVAGVKYRFEPPEYFSGIRIKTISPWIMGGLYTSFFLMIIGVYLCFFAVPAYGRIQPEGYAYSSPKKNVFVDAKFKELLAQNTVHEKKEESI